MATAHNSASKEEIAKAVLMPGDPLRAKYIAEQYLKDSVQFNQVRNMFGYTGYYKGKRLSVMGSGMGCASIGIYAHEMFHKYDVDVILRAGSCGAYSNLLDLNDILVVDSSWSQSTFAHTYSGYKGNIAYPDTELYKSIVENAQKHGIRCKEGRIHTSDCFYYRVKEDLSDIRDHKGCLGVDMESFALFHVAKEAKKKSASILTVSDHSLKKEKLSVEEREKNFDKMIQIALDTLLQYV